MTLRWSTTDASKFIFATSLSYRANSFFSTAFLFGPDNLKQAAQTFVGEK